MEPHSIRRVERHTEGVHGHSLFRRAWLPEETSRVLLVVHGYAEHSGRYEHVGAWFAARGCAVHAYDHQGHGRTSGPRCHVRRFADLLDDLRLLLERVREEHPGLPVFLIGHSMGGLAVAAFARERQPDIAGGVTSGAALAYGSQASRPLRWAARVLRHVAPRLAVDSGIDPRALSRDPEVVQRYLEDPLVVTRLTLSLAAELFGAVGRTQAGAPEIRVPLLMLHGEEDSLCPVEGTRRFFERLQVPGSRLRTYPGLRHEIFNEPERETVFRDVLAWLAERAQAQASERVAHPAPPSNSPGQRSAPKTTGDRTREPPSEVRRRPQPSAP